MKVVVVSLCNFMDAFVQWLAAYKLLVNMNGGLFFVRARWTLLGFVSCFWAPAVILATAVVIFIFVAVTARIAWQHIGAGFRRLLLMYADSSGRRPMGSSYVALATMPLCSLGCWASFPRCAGY